MKKVSRAGYELTRQERSRLDVLEEVIEYGLQTFVDVGNALTEIREGRLYRQDYSTFEDYCRDKWGMERRHAYRLMDAAETVKNVSHGTQILPANERQARPLSRLEPPQQVEAWEMAVEAAHGRVTSAHVDEAVRQVENGQGRMAVHYSSKKDDWETPQELFDVINAEFDLWLDVCATAANAKCDVFYSPEVDGLAQEWHGRCWMNPPYGDEIGQWVEKASLAALHNEATVVCLLPARVDTGWWWQWCIYGEVRFLRGRLRFGGGESGAPFPSAVVIFGPHVEAAVKWWEWKHEIQS
jgi:phage N-6-adenine-methyltransferase